MTNNNFIETLATRTGMSKKATKDFCDVFEVLFKEYITNIAKESEKSRKGFKILDMNFTVKDVAARNGRNPATGETMVIPACKKLSVKPSNDIKTVINE